jgi:hypothetical protein
MVRSLNRAVQWFATHPRLTAVLVWLVALVVHPASLYALPFAVGLIAIDDVNTVVTKEIMPGVVDGYFKAGPLIAMMKARFTRKWIGPSIQENLMFKPMRGGSYKKGGTFNVQRQQTRTGLLFTPRYLN